MFENSLESSSFGVIKRWEAIRKGFANMTKWQVLWKTSKRTMHLNCRCIKCKQVFEIKSNWVYCTRLVACGYSQLSEFYCSENYSWVMNDIRFNVLQLTMIYFILIAKTVDIKLSFLHGELEEIYVECFLNMKVLGMMTEWFWESVFMASFKQQGCMIKQL